MRFQSDYSSNSLVPEVSPIRSATGKPMGQLLGDRTSSWVKLLYPPSECSFDEALLLCQESADCWIAWVPDHGEVRLSTGSFYF
ncbi:hypothetical protein ACQ4M4_02580 [Leptolyngbya sp. AN02str]|uniref:hypothetical protein n=1 Tax=Leptolyngbya sp. AN02str TaxID=3423363 RepID=UPI003D317671